jgi:hypothetical protein
MNDIGAILVTRMLASSDQAWEPTGSILKCDFLSKNAHRTSIHYRGDEVEVFSHSRVTSSHCMKSSSTGLDRCRPPGVQSKSDAVK